MARKRADIVQWVREETKRRGLEEEVAIRLNELMLEEQLAKLRRRRGVSQAQLAKIVGVSQPVIARIESGGVQNLTVGTIVRTAAALGGTVKIGIRPKKGARRKIRKSA